MSNSRVRFTRNTIAHCIELLMHRTSVVVGGGGGGQYVEGENSKVCVFENASGNTIKD